MWLSKLTGGTTHTWEGRAYHWPADDPVCEVPAAFGEILLNIRGAGYSETAAPVAPAKEPVQPKGDGKTPAPPAKDA